MGLLSGFLLSRSEVFEGLSVEMVVETCCLCDPEDKVMSLRDAVIHLQGIHDALTERRKPNAFPISCRVYAGYI
jgi:hypothetical protein